MTPRLEKSQELNIQEMRRMMRREVEPVLTPRTWRWMWIAVAMGVIAAASMENCHRQNEAQAAYRNRPSADVVQMYSDYPVTSRDWNSQQEAAIDREYGKIAGVK